MRLGYSVVSAVGVLRGVSLREENICQVSAVAFVSVFSLK